MQSSAFSSGRKHQSTSWPSAYTNWCSFIWRKSDVASVDKVNSCPSTCMCICLSVHLPHTPHYALLFCSPPFSPSLPLSLSVANNRRSVSAYSAVRLFGGDGHIDTIRRAIARCCTPRPWLTWNAIMGPHRTGPAGLCDMGTLACCAKNPSKGKSWRSKIIN